MKEQKDALAQTIEAEQCGGLGISPRVMFEQAAKERAEVLAVIEDPKSTGTTLAAAASSRRLKFARLIELGLPRGDRQVELAMLYRKDCPADFLRESVFSRTVLGDPALPVEVARRLLESEPPANEIAALARRKDLSNKEVQLAAVRGFARTRGRDRAAYAALRCLPGGWVELEARALEAEVVGLLTNPNCPEEVVRQHLLSGSPRIRFRALRAIRVRSLPIESILIAHARDLPMTAATGAYLTHDRVRGLAAEILQSRTEKP